jgi:hypothetical protein
LTDEERAERKRLAEQRERIALVKAILTIVGVLAGLLAVGCAVLYLAVLVVRLAWGGP